MCCLLLGCRSLPDKPLWVDQPSAVYPEQLYLSAVRSGQDRTTAENNAKSELIAYFRQSIRSYTSIIDIGIQQNGRSESSTSVQQMIQAEAAMDSLIGVEVKNPWNDARGGTGWWAVAVMDKARGRDSYTSELNKTVAEINLLLNAAEEISLESMAQCRAAQEKLIQAETYALVLSLLDGPNRQSELSNLNARINAIMNEASPTSAGISFAGDAMGDRERQTIIDGLRNAMQTRNIGLALDENSQGSYVFSITIYKTQLPPTPPANTALIQADATTSFSQGGRIVCQTGPYRITEMSDAMLARRIVERLGDDGAFFVRVSEAVNQ
jgi:hypothetical protein